ncbi:MAG: PP2C family protein-serine/threonine phosphatase [Ignavibacteriaceae bacterium]
MTAIESTEISSYSFTHTGKVRGDNQDAIWLCNPNDEYTSKVGHLYGIADGMGGYAHGGLASSLALETFFETFYEANGADTIQKFRIGIQNANLSVYQAAQRLASGRMGTTITTVNIIGHNLYIGHVGDSRAYLIRDNKSTCLTNDHTQVGSLVRMKILAPEKVRTHAQRSVLEKCLGPSLFIQPDIFKIPVQNDDVIILSTDGVWSVIQDNEFAELTKTTNNPEKLGQEIVELAMERDSDDNLSIIVVYLHRLAQHVKISNSKKFWPLPNILSRFRK